MRQRLIITEEEKNQIINLHRKFINEGGPGGIDPSLQQGGQTTTATPNVAKPQLGTNTTPEEVGGTAAPTTSGATSGTTSGATSGTTVQPTVIQKGVKNPKVEALQTKLNEKFNSGLVVDGKWGPKTAAAVQKALASLPSTAAPNAGANDVKSSTAATTT